MPNPAGLSRTRSGHRHCHHLDRSSRSAVEPTCLSANSAPAHRETCAARGENLRQLSAARFSARTDSDGSTDLPPEGNVGSETREPSNESSRSRISAVRNGRDRVPTSNFKMASNKELRCACRCTASFAYAQGSDFILITLTSCLAIAEDKARECRTWDQDNRQRFAAGVRAVTRHEGSVRSENGPAWRISKPNKERKSRLSSAIRRLGARASLSHLAEHRNSPHYRNKGTYLQGQIRPPNVYPPRRAPPRRRKSSVPVPTIRCRGKTTLAVHLASGYPAQRAAVSSGTMWKVDTEVAHEMERTRR